MTKFAVSCGFSHIYWRNPLMESFTFCAVCVTNLFRLKLASLRETVIYRLFSRLTFCYVYLISHFYQVVHSQTITSDCYIVKDWFLQFIFVKQTHLHYLYLYYTRTDFCSYRHYYFYNLNIFLPRFKISTLLKRWKFIQIDIRVRLISNINPPKIVKIYLLFWKSLKNGCNNLYFHPYNFDVIYKSFSCLTSLRSNRIDVKFTFCLEI